MTYQELKEQIFKKRSFLCVGLDSDYLKLPEVVRQNNSAGDAVFQFNKEIIDATAPYCVAYKPNTAFYEVLGAEGWVALQNTVQYIRENYPDHFIIADAKRGDIGNTSKLYARAFFEMINADALTVAPYMGEDSVMPFLGYPEKWVILLGLTSNSGSKDFQMLNTDGDLKLYEQVISKSQQWGDCHEMMYVVGATNAAMFENIRSIIPDHFLLVPGVGAQGGDLEAVCLNGMNENCGLLVNSSRGIIFASNGYDFADVAASEARKLALQMAGLLEKYCKKN